MAKKKETKSKSVVKDLDLSDVESGGLVPEGEILATVSEATIETSENSGEDYIKWKFSTSKGPLFHNTSLQKQALFNLRGLLEAFGVEIPDSAFDLDLEDFIGQQCIAVVSHEEFKGKVKARVADFLPLNEAATDDDDDDDKADVKSEKPKKGDKKAKLPKIEEEELDDKDEEELAELIEQYGLEVDLSAVKSMRKKVALVTTALEEAGYLES